MAQTPEAMGETGGLGTTVGNEGLGAFFTLLGNLTRRAAGRSRSRSTPIEDEGSQEPATTTRNQESRARPSPLSQPEGQQPSLSEMLRASLIDRDPVENDPSVLREKTRIRREQLRRTYNQERETTQAQGRERQQAAQIQNLKDSLRRMGVPVPDTDDINVLREALIKARRDRGLFDSGREARDPISPEAANRMQSGLTRTERGPGTLESFEGSRREAERSRHARNLGIDDQGDLFLIDPSLTQREKTQKFRQRMDERAQQDRRSEGHIRALFGKQGP